MATSSLPLSFQRPPDFQLQITAEVIRQQLGLTPAQAYLTMDLLNNFFEKDVHLLNHSLVGNSNKQMFCKKISSLIEQYLQENPQATISEILKNAQKNHPAWYPFLMYHRAKLSQKCVDDRGRVRNSAPGAPVSNFPGNSSNQQFTHNVYPSATSLVAPSTVTTLPSVAMNGQSDLSDAAFGQPVRRDMSGAYGAHPAHGFGERSAQGLHDGNQLTRDAVPNTVPYPQSADFGTAFENYDAEYNLHDPGFAGINDDEGIDLADSAYGPSSDGVDNTHMPSASGVCNSNIDPALWQTFDVLDVFDPSNADLNL